MNTARSPTSEPISVPDSPHAFLLANVIVDDPGRGETVLLRLPDGRKVRARASANILRLGSGVVGHWRATLHFRTQRDAHVHLPLRLERLRPLSQDADGVETFWSVAGRLLKIEDQAGLLTVLIIPERPGRPSFKVTVHTPGKDLSGFEVGTDIALRGQLAGLFLKTEEVRVFERRGSLRKTRRGELLKSMRIPGPSEQE